MATLTSIPTQAGTEIVRVLLTRVAAASVDWRSSNGNVTLTGDSTFDGVVTFDGLNPYDPGQSQGAVRLRRITGSWIDYHVANPTIRLLLAVDDEAAREGISGGRGSGYWNWTFADMAAMPTAASLAPGSSILLVMWIPPVVVTRDASFTAATGDPTLTIAPEAENLTVTTRDAAFAAATGNPTLTVAPDAETVTGKDASFAATTGNPTLTVAPDTGGYAVRRDASFAAATGDPTLTVAPSVEAFGDAGFEAATGDPSLTVAPDALAVAARDAAFAASAGSL